jgi:hypothetical protein
MSSDSFDITVLRYAWADCICHAISTRAIYAVILSREFAQPVVLPEDHLLLASVPLEHLGEEPIGVLLIGPGRPVDGDIAGELGFERLHTHPARVDLLAGVTRGKFGAGDLLPSGHEFRP